METLPLQTVHLLLDPVIVENRTREISGSNAIRLKSSNPGTLHGGLSENPYSPLLTIFQQDTTSNCTGYLEVDDSWDCTSILDLYHLRIAQFYQYNPSVGADCTGMWLGKHKHSIIRTRASSLTNTQVTSSAYVSSMRLYLQKHHNNVYFIIHSRS